MRSWIRAVLVSSIVFSAVQMRSQQPSAEDFFASSIRPIFESRCYACHSGNQPKSELNLEVRALALKGGASGPVIIPGNSKDSRLIHRVLGDGAESKMPLVGKPLTS